MADQAADWTLPNASLSRVRKYLDRFGYLSKEESRSPGLTIPALQRFQSFYGIEGTAEARTDQTLEFMAHPRCGVRDFDEGQPERACSWAVGTETLIYEFGNGTEDLPAATAFGAIQEAIGIWNATLAGLGIPLAFKKKQGREAAHVRFSWEKNDTDIHSAEIFAIPFAHADFPPACGRLSKELPRPVHFEDEFDWTREDDGVGTIILPVAVHEIGHILGLTHSSNSDSVMFSSLGVGTEPSPEDKAQLKELYKEHIKHKARLSPGGPELPVPVPVPVPVPMEAARTREERRASRQTLRPRPVEEP
jgi:hypothetical protein